MSWASGELGDIKKVLFETSTLIHLLNAVKLPTSARKAQAASRSPGGLKIGHANISTLQNKATQILLFRQISRVAGRGLCISQDPHAFNRLVL